MAEHVLLKCEVLIVVDPRRCAILAQNFKTSGEILSWDLYVRLGGEDEADMPYERF